MEGKPMKCVKKEDGKGVVRRVSDSLAKQLIEKEGYIYCPKNEWKALGRLK